jgi:hypothetical protein
VSKGRTSPTNGLGVRALMSRVLGGGPLGSGPFRALSKPVLAITAALLLSLAFGVAVAMAAPVAVVENATEVGYATATISGEAENTSNESREYAVRLYTSPNFTGAFRTPLSGQLDANIGRVSFEGKVGTLTADTTYYVKLVVFSLSSTYEEEATAPAPFTTKAGSPPSGTLSPPLSITATTAAFEGEVDTHSPAAAPASYEVEEGFKTPWEIRCVDGNECSVSGSPDPVVADSSPHQVEGTLTGLLPATTYEVVLAARNASGEATSQVESFTTLAAAPLVGRTFWSSPTSTSVVLNAELDPRGASTSYHFQMVPAAEYAESGFANAYETPIQVLEPGAKSLVVSAQVDGLQPATAYRFRIVATNSIGPAEGPATSVSTRGEPSSVPLACPNELFRTGFGALLPDCRAYEQATPVDKNGGSAEGGINYVRAAEDGEGITYYSQAGVPGGEGAANTPTFLASRGASNWTTQGLLPPQSLGNTANPLGYSADLRFVVNQVRRNGVGTGLYMKDTTVGSQTMIVAPQENPGLANFGLDGISEDGDVVYFESTAVLATGAGTGVDHLYVWQRATGAVTLSGILPSGLKPAGGSFGGAYNWQAGETAVGGSLERLYVTEAHAASQNGEQVFFTAGGTGQLYLRTGVAGSHPTTVAVSASQKTNGGGPHGTDPLGPQPAAFVEATPSGSSVLFMSTEELTNDANTGAADQTRNLYQYEVASGKLTDLTPDSHDAGGADVRGVLGSGAEGASVYFVARGALAEGGEVGEENLYHYQRSGSESTISFIAQLETESSEPGSDARNWSSGFGSFEDGDRGKTARVSVAGNVLLFRSMRSLTGYNNANGSNCNGSSGQGLCQELYRYVASSGSVDCISCDPDGVAPVGAASLTNELINAFLGDATEDKAQVLPRNLSADGDRVFFQSPDALLPQDTNGSSGCRPAGEVPTCQDVYEWEAPDAPGGSCQAPEDSGGCLYLLSTGQSSQPSYFGDADLEGRNVFIFTQSQLVPADQDQLYDVYDAREEGGLAAQNERPPTSCSGEACQGPASVSPAPLSAASASLVGPKNPTAQIKKQEKKKPDSKKREKREQQKKRERKKQEGLQRNLKRRQDRHRSPRRGGNK